MRLQQLIKHHKRLLGRTQAQLVAAASEAGHPVPRAMWHKLTNEEWDDLPSTEHIRGVAAALRLTPRQVLDAATESVGFAPPVNYRGPNGHDLDIILQGCTPAERNTATDMLRLFAAQIEHTKGDHAGIDHDEQRAEK